ncbi:MAG: FAD-dependent oxidoreductase, partial [Rhodocyclales bacterium]|nr:FAD-dependent oxidoreductase [Rhodocyclales bacterium]
MESYSDDVVVIGGGIAGIVAALELLRGGAAVTILDRDVEENFGGLAKESFGGICVVGSPEQRRAKVADTPERALRDWRAFGELTDADVWPTRWAEAYVADSRRDIYDWLRAQGIGFLPLPHWIERDGNSVPRFHIVWGTGRELALVLIRRLREAAASGRLRLRFGHRVEELLVENGAVVGCRGFAGELPFAARGGAVVVAAGGINGSQELIRKHWHADWRRPPPVILNGSHKYADGLLHHAVAGVGGQLSHLERMWDYAAGVHHWRPRKPGHGLSLVPPRGALWLDWRGARLEPPLVTGFDTRDLVQRVCATERQYSWQLLNRRIAVKELAVSGAEFNPSIRDKKKLAFLRELLFGNRWLVDELTTHCEDFVVAATLPELVAKMNALQGDAGVDLAAVTAAVTSYDAAIARGEPYADEQLRRIALLRELR